MTIRVALVDDQALVRSGFAMVLSVEDDIEVVGQAADGAAAIDLVRSTDVDVVLMDVQMPVLDGIAATRQIAGADDPPRVLVLTTYDTDADILAAVEAGAAGYLLKDAPAEELLGAVRTAAAGQSALAPAVALRLMDRMRSPGQSLSAREIDVLTHVAAGRSNHQIARELFISEATVKSHLVHIFTKLDVESRTAATAKAAALGLIRR